MVESVPSFDDNYSIAEDVFYSQWNDIFIYVEDKSLEDIYYSIFRPLFPSEIKFKKIHGLGGKRQIIEEANSNCGQKNKVFLVDKDFDDILGQIVNTIPNLFYLEKYSIENYVFEENAFVRVFKEEFPRSSISSIESTICYNETFESVKSDLLLFTALFIIIQKFNLGITNCSLNLSRYFQGKSLRLDEASYLEFRKNCSLMYYGLGVSHSEFDFELEILSQLLNREQFPERHIPGKLFLELLFGRMSKRIKLTRQPPVDSLFYRLSKHCDFSDLREIIDKMVSYYFESKKMSNTINSAVAIQEVRVTR